MSQSAVRGARNIGAVSANSRLGSTSSKALEITWDTIKRATTENELRLIGLVKEYSAGHEDPRLLDNIFELLYEETSPNIMDADAGRSALHWAVLHGQVQLARTLLEAGALVNTFAKDGSTPLMAAVRKGSIEVVELLLEEGARTELINSATGAGPLLLAAVFSNMDLVQLLLERKAMPDVQWGGPNGPVTPLTAVAAKVCEPKPTAEQYLQIVEALLAAGASPDVIVDASKGETLLHNAVARSQVALVRALLGVKANPDTPSKGLTPLMTAVRLSSCELVEALIDGGAEVEAKNEFNGKSAFSMAVNLGNLELVQLLLAKGAAVDARWFNPNEYNAPILTVCCKCDESLGRGLSYSLSRSVGGSSAALNAVAVAAATAAAGSTALLSKSTSGGPEGSGPSSVSRGSGTQVYLDIVRVLLNGGADPNTQGSRNGVTPLLIAVENAHMGLLRVLLEAGANPNLADTSGDTPLISAATEGLLDMARALLDAGAAVNAQRRDGWVALMGAVLSRSAALTELLLGAGAAAGVLVPPGVHLAMESTPLMAACGEGAVDVAKLLLAAGADPNQANTAGQTAVWCACRGGRTEAVELLLAAGAKLRPNGQASLSPLVQAAYSGNRRCVELVLRAGAELEEYDTGARPDSRVLGGRFTPLAAACSRGAAATAQLLLARGADPNVTWLVEEGSSKVELTPLMAALTHPWPSDEAGQAECAALVRMLLEHRASISAAEPAHGHTALEVAAREGRHGALQVLLDSGARPNLVDKEGATPLILAALKGSAECVKLLLAAGCPAGPGCSSSSRSLLFSGPSKKRRSMAGGPITECVPQSGAGARAGGGGGVASAPGGSGKRTAGTDPNATTLVGVSPLVAAIGAFASGDGNLELIQALLDAGATPNAPFFEDDTILTAAVDGGNPALVATLLAAGANPNQTNTAGAVPLQLAVSKGHTELVRLLLDAGASPHIPGLDWSALRYHHKGRYDILELLARGGVVVPPPPPGELARGRSSSSSGQTSTSGRRLQTRPSASGAEGGGVMRRSSQGGGRVSGSGSGSGSVDRLGVGSADRVAGAGRVSGSGLDPTGSPTAAGGGGRRPAPLQVAGGSSGQLQEETAGAGAVGEAAGPSPGPSAGPSPPMGMLLRSPGAGAAHGGGTGGGGGGGGCGHSPRSGSGAGGASGRADPFGKSPSGLTRSGRADSVLTAAAAAAALVNVKSSGSEA
ncbi:hypothetical protein HYH02_005344 [Chlamydomonas schloesseri]|uniref:Uncharacterized protein n=1 Tax=Chlamydomonas schloesseri TaxID=2026947 RepID=A0A835WMT3_9CHLO|nr:hypothetical protein HYH02_005344 [Chlamydomonas schloesseri]|eukprot:KAG2449821.1 hypothetical protein HYH02_005344 [Chlamydomonas schloesseri]